jgi:hypothetical protein
MGHGTNLRLVRIPSCPKCRKAECAFLEMFAMSIADVVVVVEEGSSEGVASNGNCLAMMYEGLI